MADKRKHITRPETFKKYLSGQMSPAEQHAFEKRLLEDEFETDALEGFSQIDASELQSDLDFLKKKIEEKTERPGRTMAWRIAASVALLAVFSFVAYMLITQNTPEEVAKKYEVPEGSETESPRLQDIRTEDFIESKEIPQEELTEPSDAIESFITDIPAKASDNKDISETDTEQITTEDAHIPEPIPSIALNQKTEGEVTSEAAPGEALKKETATHSMPKTARMTSESAALRSVQPPSGTRTITGKITSEGEEEGIPGVNIILKGSATGAISDIEGNYSLEIPESKESVLVFSSVGYVSEEVVVKDQQNVNVHIQPDVNTLSEIVVIGYGAQAKKDLSGAAYGIQENQSTYIPPMPVVGNSNFKKYVKDNIRYPASGIAQGIKGSVRVAFTVGVEGRISDLVVLKSLGKDFDNEAIRLIQEGPAWEPARENDVAIEREVKLNIRFRP